MFKVDPAFQKFDNVLNKRFFFILTVKTTYNITKRVKLLKPLHVGFPCSELQLTWSKYSTSKFEHDETS